MAAAVSNSSSSKKKHKRKHDDNKNEVKLFDTIEQLENEDYSRSKKIQRKRSTKDISNAIAVQSQTKIYGHLIECRILLQRSIQEQQQQQKETNSSTSASATKKKRDSKEKITATKTLENGYNELLLQLLKARRKMKNSHINYDDDDKKNDAIDNYKRFLAGDNSVNDSDNEEEGINNKNKTKNTIDDILENEYRKCRETWKEVLNRRHKELKLFSGELSINKQKKIKQDLQQGGSNNNSQQFLRVFDSSFWNQVEATVSHEEQLRQVSSTNHSTVDNKKTTQQKTNQRLEEKDSDEEKEEKEDGSEEIENNNTNFNFDDAKIYQYMLKDFLIHASSLRDNNNNNDNSIERKLKKQQQQQQNSNNVDRKASKGRKIRYKEIPKLLNFTFPLSRHTIYSSSSKNSSNNSNLNEEEWFQSLFGGALLQQQKQEKKKKNKK